MCATFLQGSGMSCRSRDLPVNFRYSANKTHLSRLFFVGRLKRNRESSSFFIFSTNNDRHDIWSTKNFPTKLRSFRQIALNLLLGSHGFGHGVGGPTKFQGRCSKGNQEGSIGRPIRFQIQVTKTASTGKKHPLKKS